ncbi:phosphomethylpyrimidine synthase ThiC [Candidatus Soleaferrea massiliensis]|uniref:phosphomethylpyrimidine synthase ThiC n=1 Tax=Candidatus Soleaferrea massiliensis TaxID=1470354 RepID=UPI00058D3CAB|nr:phosphomethylpyrimidine synthase ThiC [Candidatus Soleaferrea massiliensis]
MYHTQMQAAKQGVLTPEMKAVAQKEFMDENVLMQRVAAGTIIIPANKNHKSLIPDGVGEGLSTKINVNLGISRDCHNIDMELDKVRLSVKMGAHAIMDLSSFGKTQEFRRRLIEESTAMIGTVPIYDAIGFYDRDLKDIKAQEFLDVLRTHARDGVDFVTIHAGINRRTAETFKNNPRITNIVSRGGSLLYTWMELTGSENPFYEYFDEVLKICREYDVTLSLGDAMRPGCTNDSTDASQIAELITLGELTRRAWEQDVQVMVEGPGHMAIDEIEANVKLEKRLCHGAPFYILGPLVTDIAPGYDHITSAIGGAIAAAAGADFLCYVTPAEHLRLPDVEDVKEGIIASQIAAHAADIAKKVPHAREIDDKMSRARQALNWEEMFSLALDEEKARSYRKNSTPEGEDCCTMCGKLCSMRNMNRIMKGEDVNLI